MKQSGVPHNQKSWFQKLLSGYTWVCNNTRLMVTFLLLYALLIILMGWHTNQALCWLTGVRHLYGVPFLIIGLLGMLTLIHEADHIWKYQWSNIPIGILSIFFIYYCMPDNSFLRQSSRELRWGNIDSTAIIRWPIHIRLLPQA